MAEPIHHAQVLKALTRDRFIRLSSLDASPLWDGVRRGHPHLDPEACASLTELLSATALLQGRTAFAERLQVLVKGSGRARAVVADCWPDGTIRGVLDLSPVPSGAWVAAPGLLQVMRSNPAGTPYIGKLELVEGPLQTQIEAYLLNSEQVQASVTLWCDPGTGESGGLLVEPMPGCPPERLRALVEALEGLEVVPLWERTPEFLGTWINQGPGVEVLSTTAMRYFCRCSRQSLLDALAGFGRERLLELFKDAADVPVRCDYCGKEYAITLADLKIAPEGGEA